ncbi:hypothetical protein BGZ49_006728, partial [Haplosporangium sp. Z 27]
LWPEPGMDIIQTAPEHITSCYMHLMQTPEDIHNRTTVDDKDCKAILEEAHGIGHAGSTQMHYNISKKGYHPMKSINAELPGEHIAIDLTGPLSPSSEVTPK